MERVIDTILNQLDGVKKNGKGFTARCPAHDDRSPSLSISEGDDGRVLLHCFAGCTVDQVCESLGMGLNELFPDQRKLSPEQKQQNSEHQRRRKLERKYELIEQWAFLAMAEFRDLTRQIFESEGLDIPDEVVEAVHKLPQVEFYMETLSTGTSEERLDLLREGVLTRWAKLYHSQKKTCLS